MILFYDLIINKMKDILYHTVGTIPRFNGKIVSTCMALVVGRYEGLLTRRSHIFRGGMHDIYFPGARGIEIHEMNKSKFSCVDAKVTCITCIGFVIRQKTVHFSCNHNLCGKIMHYERY
jgi:6,7-dimethyl-8-ribityllumazine synthase